MAPSFARLSKRPSHIRPWLTFAAVPLATAFVWILYSRFGIDHDRPLSPALPGERLDLETDAGRVGLYHAGSGRDAPLLLVHSINAAASSYEVKPLFLHYASERPVYAIDLPGFGFSERRDRVYTPRVMVDALHAAIAEIRRRHDDVPVDVIALSLSSEYAARTALERPETVRTLGMISPTGFDRRLSGRGTAQSTKGSPLGLAAVSVPLWSQALYDVFVTRPSMRFFLEKTWGSRKIDEGLLAYDYEASHQPGARHAVWSFLSGFLFADDVSSIYDALRLPVWAIRGIRGDFVDYRYADEVASKTNWTFERFDTGAFPHFERLDDVTASYDRFLARADARADERYRAS